jgi:serine carboxypeptidase-like clade 2
LANRILEGNAAGEPKINIEGFMAGNAWTYMPIDNYGAINTWWTRALVPRTAAQSILASCNLSEVGPLLEQKKSFDWHMTDACSDAIDSTMSIFSGVDI